MDHLGQIVLERIRVSVATYETELSIFFNDFLCLDIKHNNVAFGTLVS